MAWKDKGEDISAAGAKAGALAHSLAALLDGVFFSEEMDSSTRVLIKALGQKLAAALADLPREEKDE